MPRSKSPQVLITGATGALGPRVVEAFLAAGQPVRTLSLDEPEIGSLPEGVDARAGDITDSKTVASALHGIEQVVHLAALLHISDPPPHFAERYERVNVGGTRALVEGALQAGVKRVVLFSTIAVYGNAAGHGIINENTVPQPDTMYARSKHEAERVVLSARSTDGLPIGTVLRMAAIYGSRVKGNYRRLVNALAKGRFVPIGDGKNRRTLIYDRDAARAAVLAANHPDAGGELYNVSDGEYHQVNQINRAICAALERKPPRIRIPAGAVRITAGILEGLAEFVGRKSPFTRAMVDKYTEDIAVESGKIRADLGFKPEYSLSDGWHEAIEEMRRMGEL